MTIRKRLFWSNILMILVPVVAAILIVFLCMALIWFALIYGAGFDFQDSEDFARACTAITEIAEYKIETGADFSSLQPLLDRSEAMMKIVLDGQTVFTYGEISAEDDALLSAAAMLNSDAIITQSGRYLYAHHEILNECQYAIYLFGGGYTKQSAFDLKIAFAVSAIVIVFTIFLSILFTNRFLTRFVFQKIAAPLDILTNGVRQIRDGNLDYRITYEQQDEFSPVCDDFNEMAKRLKESVQQIQQQERSRKELIAGISHDIRSPLTSVQAYVEGLLDGVAKTPEAQKNYLETIKAKAEDLEHIVSQLFLFSKMDLGEYPENRCALRLDMAIVDMVSALQEEFRQKRLTISMEMEPVTLYADPVQLQRIVINILENSFKYKSKEQGHVQISLKRTKNGCRLSFADDGPGVPQQALPHLFEVFYRSDPARQNPSQGSGLGLAIVAKAVKQMHGTVTALPSRLGGLEVDIDFPKEVIEYGKNTDC